MNVGARYTDVAQAMHIHPTRAEGLHAAAWGGHRPAG